MFETLTARKSQKLLFPQSLPILDFFIIKVWGQLGEVSVVILCRHVNKCILFNFQIKQS